MPPPFIGTLLGVRPNGLPNTADGSNRQSVAIADASPYSSARLRILGPTEIADAWLTLEQAIELGLLEPVQPPSPEQVGSFR